MHSNPISTWSVEIKLFSQSLAWLNFFLVIFKVHYFSHSLRSHRIQVHKNVRTKSSVFLGLNSNMKERDNGRKNPENGCHMRYFFVLFFVFWNKVECFIQCAWTISLLFLKTEIGIHCAFGVAVVHSTILSAKYSFALCTMQLQLERNGLENV